MSLQLPGKLDRAISSCHAIESSVYGLNLTVPEDAKAIIKPWDEREENTKYVDSNVDDQVCPEYTLLVMILSF